jgi:hypothetical protein
MATYYLLLKNNILYRFCARLGAPMGCAYGARSFAVTCQLGSQAR